MMKRRVWFHIWLAGALALSMLPAPAASLAVPSRTASQSTQTQDQTEPAAPAEMSGPYVSPPVTPHLSRPVRELPVDGGVYQPGEVRNRRNPQPGSPAVNLSGAPDPLIGGTATSGTRTPAPGLSFDGITNPLGYTPPDTNGDVGPNHYVQMVNVHFAIFDKSGALLAGPTPFNALFSGAGGNCELNNDGDPVVLYDSMADRWLLSQFSDPHHMCIAISQMPDPTGSFYLYEFDVGSFPDYFKFGAWPDAYYMSANENTYTAYAFDRINMLAGDPATFQKFTGQDNFLMPADVDGASLPPAGSPGYFYTFKDNSFHGGVDRLEVYAFHVDWVTPANSTFTPNASLPIASFTYTVCGFFNLNCIPQGGTSQKVDPVSEWPMFRLPYRSFSDHESLVGNFTVDVGGDRAGIRWFELRKSGLGAWTLYQEGTYSPDANHHWMGSIIMDKRGDMALGYSVSSSSMSPAIRYTARLAGDPLGAFGAEATLIDGGGSQLASNRWGDYSAMSIDPMDGCTFWYTNEYYPTSSNTTWHTRIGTFTLPECLGLQTDLQISKSGPVVQAPGGALTYTLSITNSGPQNISPLVASNGANISIPDSGAAGTYPSSLAFASSSGTIVKASLSLYGLSHGEVSDLDVLLEGPGGETSLLMSDACTGCAVSGVDLTFEQDAPGPLPPSGELSSGVYQPSDYPPADSFPAPAPGGPYTADLSVFNGLFPDGNWNLYVVDDSPGSSGSISGGWSLTLLLANVAVTDTLPAGVTLGGVSAPGWTCSPAGNLVSCTSDTLYVGPAPDIVITATAPITTGVYTNTAAVGGVIDPLPANNTDAWATIVDRPPVAAGDTYTTTHNTSLHVQSPGLLGNDSDPDGDPLTVSLLALPASGDLAADPDGSFIYTPTLGFSGVVTFSYLAQDGWLTSPPAQVSIQVLGGPLAVTVGSTLPIQEGASANFSGGLTSLANPPASFAWDFGDGSLNMGTTLSPTLSVSHTYGDNGIYTVTLTITDNLGAAGSAFVTQTVSNAAPSLATIPNASLPAGSPLQVPIQFSDPGFLDTHLVSLDWADGVTQTFPLAAGVYVLNVPHTFTASGNYTVAVRVEDDDGGFDDLTFVVHVLPALPNPLYLPVVRR